MTMIPLVQGASNNPLSIIRNVSFLIQCKEYSKIPPWPQTKSQFHFQVQQLCFYSIFLLMCPEVMVGKMIVQRIEPWCSPKWYRMESYLPTSTRPSPVHVIVQEVSQWMDAIIPLLALTVSPSKKTKIPKLFQNKSKKK